MLSGDFVRPMVTDPFPDNLQMHIHGRCPIQLIVLAACAGQDTRILASAQADVRRLNAAANRRISLAYVRQRTVVARRNAYAKHETPVFSLSPISRCASRVCGGTRLVNITRKRLRVGLL